MISGQSINLIERTALDILDSYAGANNFILKLKHQKEINKKFYPTRSQSEYIITHHKENPKVAKKSSFENINAVSFQQKKCAALRALIRISII